VVSLHQLGKCKQHCRRLGWRVSMPHAVDGLRRSACSLKGGKDAARLPQARFPLDLLVQLAPHRAALRVWVKCNQLTVKRQSSKASLHSQFSFK
jgi:hypothetical protein